MKCQMKRPLHLKIWLSSGCLFFLFFFTHMLWLIKTIKCIPFISDSLYFSHFLEWILYPFSQDTSKIKVHFNRCDITSLKQTQSTEPREQNLNAYKSFSHWSAEADRNMVCRRYCRFTGNSLNSGSICPILYLMCPCRIRVEQVSILLKLRLLYNSRI